MKMVDDLIIYFEVLSTRSSQYFHQPNLWQWARPSPALWTGWYPPPGVKGCCDPDMFQVLPPVPQLPGDPAGPPSPACPASPGGETEVPGPGDSPASSLSVPHPASTSEISPALHTHHLLHHHQVQTLTSNAVAINDKWCPSHLVMICFIPFSSPARYLGRHQMQGTSYP